MDNFFLKKIQECLYLIEEGQESSKIINNVAEIISSRQDLLEETPNTVNLINLIAAWLNNRSVPVPEVYIALYIFWLDCIAKEKVDIFYLGDLTNLKLIAKELNPTVVKNINYLASNEKDVNSINNYIYKIEDCIAPFIIYDPDGMHFLKQINSDKPIATLNVYEVLIHNLLPTSNGLNDLTIQLANQYCRLEKPNTKTVIIGNSYGLYGFPDNLIQNCVNISMHSFGIKQAQTLVEHILVTYPHIDNFVFCIGFFDLYSDLLKSKDQFNKRVIDAYSQILSHYRIKNSSDKHSGDLNIFSRLAIRSKTESLAELQGIDDFSLRENVYNKNLNLTTSVVSLEKEQQNALSEHRALLHSKALNHQISLDENKTRVNQTSKRIESAGKMSCWVTPPFPDEYTRNIANEMKQTHRDFFKNLCDKNLRFIDFSEEKMFQPKDFRDGDHLNFTGASKLIKLLRQNKVPV